MHARTDMQRALGYRACVQEVDSFLSRGHDERLRRRLVQYLAVRQGTLAAAAATATTGVGGPSTTTASTSGRAAVASEERVFPLPADAEEYAHLSMSCSYGSADSTTGSHSPAPPTVSSASSTAAHVLPVRLPSATDDRDGRYDVDMDDRQHPTAAAAAASSSYVKTEPEVLSPASLHDRQQQPGYNFRPLPALSPMWRPW